MSMIRMTTTAAYSVIHPAASRTTPVLQLVPATTVVPRKGRTLQLTIHPAVRTKNSNNSNSKSIRRYYCSHSQSQRFWCRPSPMLFPTITRISTNKNILHRPLFYRNYLVTLKLSSYDDDVDNSDSTITTTIPTPSNGAVTVTTTRSVTSLSSPVPSHLSDSDSTTGSNSNSEVNNQKAYEQYYHCFFDQQVPEGRCVGIQLLSVPEDHIHSLLHDHLLQSASVRESQHQPHPRHWLFDFLHPEEIQYGLQLNHINHRQSFYMGRLAIRHALQQPPKVMATEAMSSECVSHHSCHPDNVTSDSSITTSIEASSFASFSPLRVTQIQSNQSDGDNPNNPVNGTNQNINDNVPSPSSIRNSILKDIYGRPQLPYGYLGSISHKGSIGVALVQELNHIVHPHHQNAPFSSTLERQTTPQMGIGVDIEDISHAHRRRNVARKVLTPNEIQTLGTLSYQHHHSSTATDHSTVHHTMTAPIPSPIASPLHYLSVEEEILLRFSCKESVYKAIHPLLNQYVSFQEAEIQPYINGTATVTLNLAPSSSTDNHTIQKQEQQFRTPIIIHWYRYENYIITTASISLQ